MRRLFVPQRLRRLNGEAAARRTERRENTDREHHRDNHRQKQERLASHHPAAGHRVECRGNDQSHRHASAELRAGTAEDACEHTAGIGSERGANADLAPPLRHRK